MTTSEPWTAYWSREANDRIWRTGYDPVGDRSRPTVSSVRVTPAPGAWLTTSTVTRINWTGKDKGSGLKQYTLQVSRNGGAWTTVALPSRLTTSFERSAAVGVSYRYRVRATDRAGNTGSWAYSATFRPTAFDDGSSQAIWSWNWSRVAAAGTVGGHLRTVSAAGAAATFRFTGLGIGIVAPRGPDRGFVQMFVDGVLTSTVDLHAAGPTAPRVIWAKSWLTAGSHTIRIRNSRDHQPPGCGDRRVRGASLARLAPGACPAPCERRRRRGLAIGSLSAPPIQTTWPIGTHRLFRAPDGASRRPDPGRRLALPSRRGSGWVPVGPLVFKTSGAALGVARWVRLPCAPARSGGSMIDARTDGRLALVRRASSACSRPRARGARRAGTSHDALADVARAVVAEERRPARGGSAPRAADDLADELRRPPRRLRPVAAPVQPTINATGVIVHTNLGRAPWPAAAIEAAAAAARDYLLLELDRATGPAWRAVPRSPRTTSSR